MMLGAAGVAAAGVKVRAEERVASHDAPPLDAYLKRGFGLITMSNY